MNVKYFATCLHLGFCGGGVFFFVGCINVKMFHSFLTSESTCMHCEHAIFCVAVLCGRCSCHIF